MSPDGIRVSFLGKHKWHCGYALIVTTNFIIYLFITSWVYDFLISSTMTDMQLYYFQLSFIHDNIYNQQFDKQVEAVLKYKDVNRIKLFISLSHSLDFNMKNKMNCSFK